ncbi:MAG: DUF3618 domain-containing protein [Actinomycetales bacterium]
MSTDGAQTPEQIRAEIAERQHRLADSVDELTTRANPKTLIADGRQEAADRIRDAVLDEQGNPRVERLAAIGGAVAAILVLVIVARRRRKQD